MSWFESKAEQNILVMVALFLPCSLFFFFFPHLISAIADFLSAILPRLVWP